MTSTDSPEPVEINPTNSVHESNGSVLRSRNPQKHVIDGDSLNAIHPRQLPPNTHRETWVFTVFFWLLDEWRGYTGTGTGGATGASGAAAGTGTGTGAVDTANGTVNGGIISNLFNYINHLILLMIFFLMSIYKNWVFVYRRIRLKLLNLAYYPNKSPHIIRDDVNKLSKIPKKITCILNFKDEEEENGGIDGLFNDISELVAWCISAGILELSIYEFNGIINNYHPDLNRYINKNLKSYFGTEFVPTIQISIPHNNKVIVNKPGKSIDLNINLISRIDGKPTIVELTKTISELAINKELNIKDINIELINEELIELVGSEPDLMIIFNPNLDLQDYPPWHIRLTEIYWEPDNTNVNYAVFIRALQKYAKSKVNIGK